MGHSGCYCLQFDPYRFPLFERTITTWTRASSSRRAFAGIAVVTDAVGGDVPLYPQDDADQYQRVVEVIVSHHTHCCPEDAERNVDENGTQSLEIPCICQANLVWSNATCTPCPGDQIPIAPVVSSAWIPA